MYSRDRKGQYAAGQPQSKIYVRDDNHVGSERMFPTNRQVRKPQSSFFPFSLSFLTYEYFPNEIKLKELNKQIKRCGTEHLGIWCHRNQWNHQLIVSLCIFNSTLLHSFPTTWIKAIISWSQENVYKGHWPVQYSSQISSKQLLVVNNGNKTGQRNPNFNLQNSSNMTAIAKTQLLNVQLHIYTIRVWLQKLKEQWLIWK